MTRTRIRRKFSIDFIFNFAFPSTVYRLLIRVHLQVVEVDFGEGVAEDAGAALTVSDGVCALDEPAFRLRAPGGPDLAARAHLTVREILDAQLHTIPSVLLPLERHGDG